MVKFKVTNGTEKVAKTQRPKIFFSQNPEDQFNVMPSRQLKKSIRKNGSTVTCYGLTGSDYFEKNKKLCEKV